MLLKLLNENPSRLKAVVKMLTQGKGGADENIALRVAQTLLDVDPTPNKQYALWLSALTRRGLVAVGDNPHAHGYDWWKKLIPATEKTQILLPDEKRRVADTIEAFDKVKGKLPADKRDINKFDFNTLEEFVESFENVSRCYNCS